MPLYKVTTENPEHGSDCIQARNFDEAEDIACESISRLKTELGITKKLYVVIEVLDFVGHENHFVDLFV